MQGAITQIAGALVAVVVGVLGALGMYLGGEWLIGFLREERRPQLRPWLYIGPALLILGGYLVYPVVNTFRLSFYGPRSEEYVGLDNYVYTFTNSSVLTAMRNNLLWLVLATILCVGLGLIVAVLTDRVSYESTAKSVVFLPMAVSFVAAGVIWKFVYAFRPGGTSQIGLLNAVGTTIIRAEPIGWLVNRTTNNFALIVAFVWVWTGFCMVILSAALKGIPQEIIEAARVDGANEWQIFWRITIPMISSTIAVVTTTMIINVLKIFDIVYVMTNGNFGTDVVANRMYKEMFNFRHFGRASSLAVILLLAIVPVMFVNIRRFQIQEERR